MEGVDEPLEQWSSGILACTEAPDIGCFCSCWLAASLHQNLKWSNRNRDLSCEPSSPCASEREDASCDSTFGTCCLSTLFPCVCCYWRNQMRSLYSIQGSFCEDCIYIACCGPCAICQQARHWEDDQCDGFLVAENRSRGPDRTHFGGIASPMHTLHQPNMYYSMP